MFTSDEASTFVSAVLEVTLFDVGFCVCVRVCMCVCACACVCVCVTNII